MKRPWFIFGALLIGIGGLFWYRYLEAPSAIATKGSGDPTLAWIALAISILSFLTALIGLVQKLFELRRTADR
ncbi:MAG: hypothetical protein ACR2RA_23420 [Geminicoccaceae bacterium]